MATHDPDKILIDLAVTVALDGTASPIWLSCGRSLGCSGSVASDPTVSRLFTTLAADALAAVAAITARHPVIIDLDATLVSAHSEKGHAAPTQQQNEGGKLDQPTGAAKHIRHVKDRC